MALKGLVCGVGINDSTYNVQTTALKGDGSKRRITTWMCPFYQTWFNMISRCYSEAYHKRNESYMECEVCEEWRYFMNFRSWMISQDWEGKQLDKDLLYIGNKTYSPSKCIFLPRDLNAFIVDSRRNRGECPLGVRKDARGKTTLYYAEISDPFSKCHNKYLGTRHDPIEAHLLWLAKKHELACIFAERETDPRIVQALQTRYSEVNSLYL